MQTIATPLHRTARSRTEPTGTLMHGTTSEELSRAANQFGQMDVGDPRWADLTDELDRLVLDELELTDDPRRHTWRAAATHPEAPLVVKLRVLAAVAHSIATQPQAPSRRT
jgi:hypothetical protein